MDIFQELTLVDKFLGLPDGFTLATICDHTEANVPLFNEKVAEHGIQLNKNATLVRSTRPQWKMLMQKLGVSNAWWMDGNASKPMPEIHILD